MWIEFNNWLNEKLSVQRCRPKSIGVNVKREAFAKMPF